MARRLTTIAFDEEQVRALERIAERESAPLDVLVRRAVDRYLATQADDWASKFDDLVARVQTRLPDDLTPEEIEADITAAAAETRVARARRRT